jgi:hypothetical protein
MRLQPSPRGQIRLGERTVLVLSLSALVSLGSVLIALDGSAPEASAPVPLVTLTTTASGEVRSFADKVTTTGAVDDGAGTAAPLARVPLSTVPAPARSLFAELPETGGRDAGQAPSSDAQPSPKLRTSYQDLSSAVGATEASPAAPAAASPEKWAISGTWSPDRGVCTRKSADKAGVFLMRIDENGARSGDTTCTFVRRQQDGETWTVSARCSGPEQRWTSRVRLDLAGNKLTWQSERGTQTYARCDQVKVATR